MVIAVLLIYDSAQIANRVVIAFPFFCLSGTTRASLSPEIQSACVAAPATSEGQ
jgi:hypothetical protein